ncbi:HPr family phosphocarrier protein [Fangia hongkongensis]|uniref:HPr family phosphocarrier protein n=1 Tax=Fangia hongkongensis TaxID=270495 RepID=UPI000373A937|nr:HPr family phosphocarrier protein [Fangia hongkongensis]MBK2125173.1 HPr family phosphocarrier protein [Fangia hongkongensis]
MIEVALVISNELGLHARASSKLVSLASKFASEITINALNEKMSANCKSIMGIMMLGIGVGTAVQLTFEGEDEFEASKAVKALIQDKFGEEK